MALSKELKPIKDAVLDNLNKKDPEDILFIVGGKTYTVKEVIKHFKKEDKFSKNLITTAVLSISKRNKFDINKVTNEEIQEVIQMFKL